MSQSTGPFTVLITGATDGIGLALARLYAAQGARLILVGRKPLAALAGTAGADTPAADTDLFTPTTYCQADLSAPQCHLVIGTWLTGHQVERLDVVIHNAGLGYVGDLARQDAESIAQLVAVNVRAPIAVTHQLLPLVAAAHGKMVYISSVAAVLPGPDYAVYTATKAALDGFVRNLRIELNAAKRPVTVQLIHPGATRTGMHAKSGLSQARVDWTTFPPAEQVAQEIERIIRAGSRRRAVGLTNRLGLAAGLAVPGLIDGIMVRGSRRKGGPMPQVDRPPERPHCVITGAADGIGRALALAFAGAGYVVTGVDVDQARAAQTAQELSAISGDAQIVTADLAAADAIPRLLDKLTARPMVDVLIHNAGINAVGHFAQMPLARQLLVLDVNFRAPLLLTAGLLDQNRLAAHGTVVCIASLSYFVSYPGAAVYAASKDGLTSFARSLRVALTPADINVLTVFPGPTRTAHARRYSPDNRRESKRMAPVELAARILAAVMARRHRLIPGPSNRLSAGLGRLAPRLTEWAMQKTILDKIDDQPPAA